jgi:hypothetical protein
MGPGDERTVPHADSRAAEGARHERVTSALADVTPPPAGPPLSGVGRAPTSSWSLGVGLGSAP